MIVDSKMFLEKNKYQDYVIEILFSMYQKYCEEKFQGKAPNIDNFFKAFFYPIENALISHYAVWLNDNKDKFVSIERITRENGPFKNIAITNRAYNKILEYFNSLKKKDKKDVNKYIHWEHITPKSVCYQKLKDIFQNGKTLTIDDFKEKLVKEVLYKNKILIMSKEESKLLDETPNRWSEYYCSQYKKNRDIQLLKPFMNKMAEALTRLYYLSLIDENIEISFDGCSSFHKISDIIDVKNTPTSINLNYENFKKSNDKFLSDKVLGITAKSPLTEYFDNYNY